MEIGRNLSRFIQKCIAVGFLLSLSSLSAIYANKSDSYYSRAELAASRKQWDKAILLLKKHLRSDKKDSAAWILLGKMFYYKEDLASSKRSFDKLEALTVDASYAFAWGAAYYASGDWQKASRGFKVAVKNKTRTDFSLYYLGVCAFKLGDLYRAEKFLLRSKDSVLTKKLRINKRKILRQIRKKSQEDLSLVLSSPIGDSKSFGISDRFARFPIPLQDEGFVFDEQKNDTQVDDQVWEVDYEPKISFIQDYVSQDNFGVINNRLVLSGHIEQIGVDIYRRTQDQSLSEAASFGVELDLAHAQYQASVIEEVLFKLQETSGSFLKKQEQSLSDQQALLGLNMYWNLAITPATELKLTGFSLQALASYDIKQSFGSNGLRANFSLLTEIANFFIQLGYSDNIDKLEGVSNQDQVFDLGLIHASESRTIKASISGLLRSGQLGLATNPYRYRFSFLNDNLADGFTKKQQINAYWLERFSSFSLELVVLNKIRENPDLVRFSRILPVESIRSAALGESYFQAGVNWEALTGITLRAGGAVSQINDYYYLAREADGTNQAYLTDVGDLSYFLGLQVRPLEWLAISAGFNSSSYTYNEQVSAQRVFQLSNPNIVSSTELAVEASTRF